MLSCTQSDQLLILFDVLADITDGGHLHSFLVGNGDTEVLLQIHHQLNDVEGVSVQIFLDLGVHGHGRCVCVELLSQQLTNLFKHSVSPF